MASTGKTGRGVKFQIGNGASPEVFTSVGNVAGINFTGRNAEEIDFTNLDSAGGYRELRQGFKDGGSVQVQYQFDPTDSTHADLLAKFTSGDTFNWRVNFFGAGWGKAMEGTGFVQNPGDINVNATDPIGGQATIRVTGDSSLVNVSA